MSRVVREEVALAGAGVELWARWRGRVWSETSMNLGATQNIMQGKKQVVRLESVT